MTQQANATRYTFTPARLPGDTFQVVSFKGTEELARLYAFEIRLVAQTPDLDFAGLINQPATLGIEGDGAPAVLAGLVTRVEQAGRTADYVLYRAVLRPRLWRLTLTHQSRIFQNQTVEDVVTEVLGGAGLTAKDVAFRLTETYTPREYCVQYQETDFDFVSRLLEFEGICYYFEHTGEGERLVLTDRHTRHARIAGPPALPYRAGAGLAPDSPEHIERLTCREEVVTGQVVLKDYNYRTPKTDLTVASSRDDAMPGEHYEYGGPYQDARQGRRLARMRHEEIACRRRVFTGQSNSPALRTGHRFTLDGHYRPDLDQDYLVTRVEHRGSQRQALGLAGLEDEPSHPTGTPGGDGYAAPEAVYENTFTCIPAATPFRPARQTPVPKIPGLLTATVESAGGPYAYLDDDGRYRVKMPFDRSGRGGGTASLPIRLAQPHGGPGYGVHFPNHAGTEMAVAFVGGDVDRPLALGAVPNPVQQSPATAANRMHNVVRTAGGNELLLDDTRGEARVHLRTAEQHELLLDDREDRIRLATTGRHQATFDDKARRIEVRSTGGHTVVLDDEAGRLELKTKAGHCIVLDDEARQVTVADADQKHRFVIDASSGTIQIQTDGDLHLHAPDGRIDVRARELNVETTGPTRFAAEQFTAEASGDLALKGANLTSQAGQEHRTEGQRVTSKGGTQQLEGQTVAVKGRSIKIG